MSKPAIQDDQDLPAWVYGVISGNIHEGVLICHMCARLRLRRCECMTAWHRYSLNTNRGDN